VTKAILVAQFLQARARWRLDSAGACALHVARSVVCLLDAAVYLQDIPDDDPDIQALDAAGCFRGNVFDPGPEGAVIVRGWQLADEPSAGPRDLLAGLARAAHRARPDVGHAIPAVAVGIPRQAGAQGPVGTRYRG
jgi:hypothetical protein